MTHENKINLVIQVLMFLMFYCISRAALVIRPKQPLWDSQALVLLQHDVTAAAGTFGTATIAISFLLIRKIRVPWSGKNVLPQPLTSRIVQG